MILLGTSGKIWVRKATPVQWQCCHQPAAHEGEAVSGPSDPVESYLADAGVPDDQRGDNDNWDADPWPNLLEFVYDLNLPRLQWFQADDGLDSRRRIP